MLMVVGEESNFVLGAIELFGRLLCVEFDGISGAERGTFHFVDGGVAIFDAENVGAAVEVARFFVADPGCRGGFAGAVRGKFVAFVFAAGGEFAFGMFVLVEEEGVLRWGGQGGQGGD